jgi:hypothetical protein
MGIMVNRAEKRVRVRQGRQLRENKDFLTLLHRSERYALSANSDSNFSSDITFIEPSTSIFSEASTSSENIPVIEGKGADNGDRSSLPVESPSTHQPIITLPMPPPVTVTQKEFSFSKEGEHVPLRERLRLKRQDELKKKREREEAGVAFAKANGAIEMAKTAPSELTERPAEPSVQAIPTTDSAQSTAVAGVVSEDAKQASPQPEKLPAQVSPGRMLHITVPALEITPQQSDRYDAIVTEAKVSIWAATQQRLELLSQVEQLFDKTEDKMKKIRRLPPLSTKCISLDEQLRQCIEASNSLQDIEARRLACANDRELLLSCYKSQE